MCQECDDADGAGGYRQMMSGSPHVKATTNVMPGDHRGRDCEARLVDEFRFAIDDLGSVIEQLRVRALPVSLPEYADPNCVPDMPPSSAARNELYRLHMATGALRGIIDRLEV